MLTEHHTSCLLSLKGSTHSRAASEWRQIPTAFSATRVDFGGCLSAAVHIFTSREKVLNGALVRLRRACCMWREDDHGQNLSQVWLQGPEVLYEGWSAMEQRRVQPRNYQAIEEVAESSTVEVGAQVDFLQLSLLTARQVHELLRSQKHILNEVQCWDLSTKLSRAALNVEHLVHFSGGLECATPLQSFFRITETAKQLVQSCCDRNWCHAAALQIHNEEAFREILAQTGLCYDEICEQARENDEIEDLRQSSAFSPPTATEIRKDQETLYARLRGFVVAQPQHWSEDVVQRRRLALQLLEKLHASLYRGSRLGIEWDDFLLEFWGECDPIRGSVFRTTWLGMPCAKKVAAMHAAAAALNHPNLVKLLHWEDDCFAMELMEMSLDDALRERRAPFPLRVSVDILMQIATGLCYLHDHDIALRDLKPSNILVNRQSSPYLHGYFQVKLAEYGLLKPAARSSRYRAPEAFSQDGRSAKFAIKGDVYSFAVIAAHILTGRSPPNSQVNEAILKPQLPSDCPEMLASVVRECLVQDYRKRPPFLDICCRLESVRNRLGGEDHHRPTVTDYAHGMCSRRSAVRQRGSAVVVHEDKRSAFHSIRSIPDSARSMPATSSEAARSSSDPHQFVSEHQFVSDSHIKRKSHSDQVAEIDESSALVNELITKLSSRSTKVHRDAAKTIRCLAKINKENRILIAEQGGIPFLINLLRSPDEETQEHAITALMNLSLHPNNRGLIMRAGAIDGIVHVVKHGESTDARENAAAAIQCLSYDNENKISIGNTGAIPALVQLLRTGTRQGKKDAAHALCNLVSYLDGNKKRATDAGLTPLLMEVLRDDSNELDDITLSILANLSLLKQGLVEIGKTEPVDTLVDYITCGSQKGKELATSLLCKLCQGEPNFIEVAYHCGVTCPLAALLRDEHATERCKRKGAQLMNLLR